METADKKERIGFIGLGIMGRPMALNLIKAGYFLHVYDIEKSRMQPLLDAGASDAASCYHIARVSDIIITMVPDSPEVEHVIWGENGIIEAVRPGTLYIDMSTIAPSMAQRVHKALAGKEVEALDAPVSGGQVGAEAGTLSIMVGGLKTAFQRALPVLQVMGKNIVYVGEPGAGQVTKACNQIVVGTTIQGVAEALTLAKKAGVDVAKVREALLGGFAQSRILDLHGQRILEHNFRPGFKAWMHRKDMNIALQTGRELSVPLPASAQVAVQLDALLARGDGELDHSALAKLLAEMSGID